MTDELFTVPRQLQVMAPGAVHLPQWLNEQRQRYLLQACAHWVRDSGTRRIVLPGGGHMTVRTTSLGRQWEPYRYLDIPDVIPVPPWLVRAARQALTAAAAVDEHVLWRAPIPTSGSIATPAPKVKGEASLLPEDFTPDAVLVNLYGPGASMGLHQDRDELVGEPVVSLSVGDSALFRFGTAERRGPPYTDVRLESGDLVVFGGPSRFAFHGVPKVFDGTAPSWCTTVLGGQPGRVNLTIRRTR